MLVAGCDLGSAAGKAVIMADGEIRAWAVVQATTSPEKTAFLVLGEAAKLAGLNTIEDLQYIMGTGYGRATVSLTHDNMSEISCHARGAHWLHPAARTVVDVGGQDCKVISIDDEGRVLDFQMNDKCAAGTGRFFEAMSRVLHCSLEKFSELSMQSDNPANITKQCSVFAESEVVTLINNGVPVHHIAAGLTDSIARRLLAMVYRLGAVEDIVVTGGCAKNEGMVRSLESRLGHTIVRLAQNPQTVGALGAALFAREKLMQK
ncbi:CoA activase [Geobacter sp. FeAm09]|uniref:acyl-CoA dehydratase activase n=1 Tax=Geobacter sp. FeAm09 TaxID=2597769 RepID=UPI0011EF63AE|nr:acyl-CoA dehydratase activase [Geobacter sp. FeAm09]QEM67700.1 CoA activase [Geobacter sp. FeAm09]